jgi:hypothetical protein
MSNAFPIQGDSEAAVIDILNSDSSVMAFSPINITTDRVGYTMGDVWIEVTRQGGNLTRYVIDKPRIDINVYGPNRITAHDLAQAAQAAVLNARGTYRGNGCFLSDARVETGIFRGNDLLNESPRYVFSLRLTTTPRT